MSKSQALLVNVGDEEGSYCPPMGLMMLYASLKGKGISCDVLDLQFSPDKEKALLRAVSEKKPGVVGFYGLAFNRDNVASLAGSVKEKFPDSFIASGGPFFGLAYSQYLEGGIFDAVCRGEGEGAFPELVKTVCQDYSSEDERNNAILGVSGFAFNIGGKVICSAPRARFRDLDGLPMPDWSKFPVGEYFDMRRQAGKMAVLPVDTSRGCPSGCSFCSCTQFEGRLVRVKSPERVVSELKLLKKKHNPDMFLLTDDTFCVNRGRVLKILDLMDGEGIDKPWVCLSTVSSLDFELLKRMKASGLCQVQFGVESANPAVRNKNIGKKFSNGDVFRLAGWLKDLDLDAGAFFIFGLPGETVDDLDKSNEMAYKLQSEYGVESALIAGTTIYPGTGVHKKYGQSISWISAAPPLNILALDPFVPVFSKKLMSDIHRFSTVLYPKERMELIKVVIDEERRRQKTGNFDRIEDNDLANLLLGKKSTSRQRTVKR